MTSQALRLAFKPSGLPCRTSGWPPDTQTDLPGLLASFHTLSGLLGPLAGLPGLLDGLWILSIDPLTGLLYLASKTIYVAFPSPLLSLTLSPGGEGMEKCQKRISLCYWPLWDC